MIHDFNIDRPVTVNRASGAPLPHSAGPRFNDEYTEFKIMNGLALAVFLIVLITAGAVAFHHFLEAVPALSRVVTGGK